MILGMSTAPFTLLHGVINLVGLGSGVVLASGLWRARRFHPGPPAAARA
jgi:hypothetical protein